MLSVLLHYSTGMYDGWMATVWMGCVVFTVQPSFKQLFVSLITVIYHSTLFIIHQHNNIYIYIYITYVLVRQITMWMAW
jgi:hypothetical protein